MMILLEECKRRADVKVVVWTSSGERAFSSGASMLPPADIELPDDMMEVYARRELTPNLRHDNALMRETRAFWDFPKPIIGAINGMAVGGGANIALCFFDLVLCSTNARFKYPFVDIGFTPELSSSLVLPFVMGPVRAKQVIFTGEWFSPQQSMEWGLINAVHAPEDLMPKAMELANMLASKPNNQLILSKKVLNYRLRKDLDEHLRMENEVIQASVFDFGGRDRFLEAAMKTAGKNKNKNKNTKAKL